MKPPLECHSSKTFQGIAIVWFSGMLLVGLLVLWHSLPSAGATRLIVSSLGTVVIAGMVILAVAQSKEKRPYLIISSDGLHIRSSGLPPIPWKDIREIRSRNSFGHEFLDVFLIMDAKYAAMLKGWRWLQAKTRRKNDPLLSVIVSSLAVPSHEICDAIAQYVPITDPER